MIINKINFKNMNRIKITLLPTILFMLSIVFLYNAENIETPLRIESANAAVEMPSNIKAILENSCTGCHNSESKNTKGKKKLDFDNFNNGKYTVGKQIAKLNGIVKILSKSQMPPKNFLKKFPDRALSVDDNKALSKWAKDKAAKLAVN